MRSTLLALCAHLLLLTAGTMLHTNTDKEIAKSLEFVKIIREDLRRNNDDYEMLERPKTAPTRAQAPRSPPPAPRNRIPSARPPPPRGAPPPPPPRTQPRNQPRNQPRTQPRTQPRIRPRTRPRTQRHRVTSAGVGQRGSLPRRPPQLSNTEKSLNMYNFTSDTSVVYYTFPNTSHFRSHTHGRHYNKIRIDKLKRLTNKEKKRMRKLGRTGTDVAPDDGTTQPNITQSTTPSPLTTELDAADEPSMLPLMKINSPSPDQLDMAPAKGSLITHIRFKGRLCQRNLMNIEGPTYDKTGKAVIPAHKPNIAYGHQFHQTRQPALILPRCCNCCKKSVLGCQ